MKSFSKIISLCAVGLTLAFSSCESLDTTPPDYFGSGNFWKDAAQVSGYMNGLHGYVRSSYSSNFFMGELRGGILGDGDAGTGVSVEGASMANQAIIKQDLREDQALFGNWNGIYAYIIRCNELLMKIDNLDFLTDQQKNLYKAQAHGMRAYYYFLLYRTWGGVPKVTGLDIMDGKVTAERLYRKQSSPEEILTLIKDDVNASENFFNQYGTPFKDVYTWNKYATLMLKANVYTWAAKVTTGDHQKTGAADLQVAKTALEEVIGSHRFELLPNFAQVFSPDNKANKEIIFAVAYNTTDKVYTPDVSQFVPQTNLITSLYDSVGNQLTLNNDRYGVRAFSGGLLRYQYKETFWRSFEPTDSRREGTFYNLFKTPDGPKTGDDFGVIVRKFSGHYEAGESTHYWDCDGILFRYAEALLLMAEVENALGNDPTPYINQIRQRALGTGYTAVANGSKTDNELAILKERDKEFIMEGKRWFDVLRMQDASGNPLVFSATANYPFKVGGEQAPILNQATEAHKVLFPVDKNTLTNDPDLEQNPGY